MRSALRRHQAPPVRVLAAAIAAAPPHAHPPYADPPETAEVTDLTRHGITRFQAGDYAQASRIFTALVGGAPQRVVSWNHHALALVALGRDAEAARALRRSLEINPRQLETWESLACVLSRLGRHDDAEAACRAAQTLGGESTVVWQVIAMARTAGDDFAGAAEAFAQAIALGGMNAGLCANQGAALLKCGRFGEAASALTAAAALDPTSAPIAQAKGLCDLILASQAGDPSPALAATGGDGPDDLFKTALLLLDAHGEREAAATLAGYWADRRPGDIEAAHLRNALMARRVERQPAELVAKSFDTLADAFDEHLVNRLGYDGPAKLAVLLGPVGAAQGALEVLDLGCGTGLCAPVLRPYANRLIGVDLSAGMLAKARDRGLYDRLDQADLLQTLAEADGAYGMIVAFDTFPYIGALEAVFDAVAARLSPGGWFVFSTEHAEGDSFVLRGNGRFAHGEAYVEALAAGRFAIASRMQGTLRREAGRAVGGAYYLLRAPG